MLKIGTKDDCQKLSHLPIEVQYEVENIISKLNFYYGEHRNIDKDMGGYVLIVENVFDYEKLMEIFNQPVYELIPEYVDLIITSEENYTNSLILCNNDFTITLIAIEALTPQTFFKYVENEDN